MRSIKTLGLAVVAAMVTIAFVGASLASAVPTRVVLCEVKVLECPAPFPNPTTIVAHAEDPKLLTSLGTILCEKSLAELTLLNELSELVVTHVLALSFENCKIGKTACTATVDSLGLVSYTHDEPALKAFAKSTGGTKVTVKCGSLLNCKYGGEPTFVVHSTEEGVTNLLAGETTILNEEGEKFICPNTSRLDATYTALGTVWIES